MIEFIFIRLAIGYFIMTLFELSVYDKSYFWISICEFEYETSKTEFDRSLFYFEYNRGRIKTQFLFLNLIT